MAAYQAGAAFITIAPSFEGVQGAIAGEMERYGDDAGRTFGDRWAASASSSMQDALDSLPEIEITADSSDADRKLAELRDRMETLGAAEVGVDIDERGATAELAAIRDELQALDRDDVHIGVDTSGIGEAVAQLTALEVAVNGVDGKDVDVPTKTDAPATAQSLARLGDTLDGLASKALVGSLVGAGLAGIIPMAAGAAAAVTGLGGALAGLAAGGGVLALAIGPVVKALQAQDAASSSAASSSASAAKAAEAHAQAVESAEQRVGDAQRSAADAAQAAHQADEDAAKRVEAAQQGIADATLKASEQVTTARRRVSDAVQAAADADEKASRRVADAQDALAKAHTEAAQRVQDAQDALVQAHTDAADRVAEAQERLTQAAADAAERVQSAEDRAAQAAQDAAERVQSAKDAVVAARAAEARGIEDAARRIEAAERALAAAQDRSRDAQEALTRAREDARQRLEDLDAAVKGGELNARAAAQSLADARAEYARASGSGDVEAASRALLAADQAQFRVEEVARTNARLAAQKAEADKKGIEGSDQVTAALKGVQDATARVGDAQQGLADAHEAATQAQVDGVKRVQDAQAALLKTQTDAARSVRDAQAAVDKARLDGMRSVEAASKALDKAQTDSARRVEAAQKSLTKAQTDGVERVRSAERALSDAQRAAVDTHQQGLRRVADAQAGVVKAQRDGARSVQDAEKRLADAREQQVRTHEAGLKRIADAQRSLARAQADLARTRADAPASGGGGSAASKGLADAMAKLTPAGKEFLALLQQMKGHFDALSRTAQDAALPGITRALKSLEPAFGPINTLVAALGRTLGKLAEDGAAQLRGPFWTGFGKMVAENLPRWLDQGARIIGNFGTAFAAVFKAMMPLGNQFLGWLLKFSQDVAAKSKDVEKSDGFAKFSKYITDNAPKVKALFADLSAAVIKIVKDLAPFGPAVLDVADKLAQVVAATPPGFFENLTKSVGPTAVAFKALGTAVSIAGAIKDANAAFVEFKATAAGTKIIDSLTSAVKGLGGGIKALGMAMVTPPLGVVVAIGAIIGALVLLYQHNEGFRKFVDGMVAKVKELGAKGLDWLRDKVSGLVDWLKKNWQDVLVGILTGPLGLAVKYVVQHWDEIKGAVQRKAGEVKDAITRKASEWGTAIRDAAGRMVSGIGDKLSGMAGAVRRKLDDVRSTIAGAINGWLQQLYTFKPWEWLSQAFDAAVKWIKGPVDQITNMIKTVSQGAAGIVGKLNPASWGWADGGMVEPPPGFASGGLVPGRAPARRGIDNLTVPLRDSVGRFVAAVGLRSGEFVQPEESVAYYGAHVMEAIRRRAIPAADLAGLVRGSYSGPVASSAPLGYASGGLVGAARAAVSGSASGAVGPVVAVLEPSAQRALVAAAQAGDRPIRVDIDGRALLTATAAASARFAHR